MQISRHWRMNPQRYRLQGVRYANREVLLQEGCVPPSFEYKGGPERGSNVSSEIYTKEKRHVGALLLLHDGKGNLWVMDDEVKTEMSTGMETPLFINAPEKRLSVPGGGSQEGETFISTLKREFNEETDLHLPGDIDIELVSSDFFVVNQLIKDENHQPLRIDQFGAWVATAYVNPSSDFYIHLSQFGRWEDVNMLLQAFSNFTSAEAYENDGYQYRPQLLTAVAVANRKLQDENLFKMNAAVSDKAYRLAEIYQIPVNNGVVGRDGRIEPKAEGLVRDFLLSE